jgi:hypothetical protein
LIARTERSIFPGLPLVVQTRGLTASVSRPLPLWTTYAKAARVAVLHCSIAGIAAWIGIAAAQRSGLDRIAASIAWQYSAKLRWP